MCIIHFDFIVFCYYIWELFLKFCCATFQMHLGTSQNSNDWSKKGCAKPCKKLRKIKVNITNRYEIKILIDLKLKWKEKVKTYNIRNFVKKKRQSQNILLYQDPIIVSNQHWRTCQKILFNRLSHLRSRVKSTLFHQSSTWIFQWLLGVWQIHKVVKV